MPRPRLTKYGGVVSNTKKIREYKKTVALYATRKWHHDPSLPLKGDCGLRLELARKTRVRGDLDNFAKAVMDALLGIAYLDDRQLVELSTRVMYGAKRPRVEITLYDLETVP